MTIEIIARRWRDTYGSTYHTVEIRRSGSRQSLITDPAYGYESAWEDSALEILCPLYGGPGYLGVWHWSKTTGIKIDHTVIDVNRKRDLSPHTAN